LGERGQGFAILLGKGKAALLILYVILGHMSLFFEMLLRIRRELGSQVKTTVLISKSSKSVLVKNEIVNTIWMGLLGF
jgi:hypothetical protein